MRSQLNARTLARSHGFVIYPAEILQSGVAILDPICNGAGFLFGARREGAGKMGAFASGEYSRGDRRLELHFRHSLGLVTYHVAELSMSHEAYMKALGVRIGSAHYPGFSEDPLDGFRHLALDLREFAAEFLSGDAAILRKLAPLESNERAIEWRKEQASYMGDTAKRLEAKERFSRHEYAKVVELLESLHDPELMSPSENMQLEIARRRTLSRDVAH